MSGSNGPHPVKQKANDPLDCGLHLLLRRLLDVVLGSRNGVGVGLDPHEVVDDGADNDADSQAAEASVPEVPVAAEDGGEGEGKDGHELDEDVEGGARGVLAGVADGVTNNSSLVGFALLAAEDALVLNVLLGVVPGAAGVGHHDSKDKAGGDGTSEEAAEAVGADQETNGDGGEDGDGAGEEHLGDGGLGAERDAAGGVAGDALAALEEARDGAELPLDLNDDGTGSLADAEHGEGGEEVGEHGADEDSGEHEGVGEVEDELGGVEGLEAPCLGLDGLVGSHGEGVEESQGGQDSGADGKALAGGSGGVAEGVELVGALTDFVGDLRAHLGEAAGVVGNGAVGIGGEGDSEGGQHADGSDADAVDARESEAGNDGHGDDQDGGDGREHADAETLDDDSGGAAHGAGLGDGLGGGEAVGCEELGALADQDAGDETNDDAAVVLPGLVHLGDAVVLKEEPHGEGSEAADEDGSEVDAAVEGVEEGLLVGVVLGADNEESDDGGEGSEASDPEGQGELGVAGGEGGGGDNGANEGLEEISAHAGNISDVVTDVVGNGGRVAGVVLGDVALDLSDEVSSDVGSLGVDAAGNTSKEGDGGGAESEAGEEADGGHHVEVHACLAAVNEAEGHGEDVEEDGEAQDAKGDDDEAHDGASSEGDAEGLVEAGLGGLHGLHVASGGDLHSAPAGSSRQDSANQEADHGLVTPKAESCHSQIQHCSNTIIIQTLEINR